MEETNGAVSQDPNTATTTAAEREEAGKMRKGAVRSDVGNAEVGQNDQQKLSPEEAQQRLYSEVPSCVIDEDCRQKYVLIQVTAPIFPEPIYLVRARMHASYHKDAAQPTLQQLNQSAIPGLTYIVLGGGRIEHNLKDKEIKIYGHSYGFPWESGYKHEISAAVVEKQFPDYAVIPDNTVGLY